MRLVQDLVKAQLALFLVMQLEFDDQMSDLEKPYYWFLARVYGGLRDFTPLPAARLHTFSPKDIEICSSLTLGRGIIYGLEET